MSPPKTITWPLFALTILSDSRISLSASGKEKAESPTTIFFCSSVTVLITGWICKITSPSSEICGVTSKDIPLKKEDSSISGDDVVDDAFEIVELDIPVTKN